MNSSFRKFRICNLQSVICNSCGRGFTLLEILVSLALLSIALVVILQLFSANLKGIAASDDYVNAVLKAESVMREILEDDELTEGTWSEITEDGYTINADIISTVNDRTENLPINLLEITLTIRWTKDSKERRLNLKTMKVVTK